MIKINHLSKKFGNLEVLKDINLDIEGGEVVCIIGPSGSGKSTFLRCINQLEMPTGGTVQYEGRDLLDKNCDIRKFREEVGIGSRACGRCVGCYESTCKRRNDDACGNT